MASDLPEDEIQLTKWTIRTLKRYIRLLEHAKSHLEQIAEEECDDADVEADEVEVAEVAGAQAPVAPPPPPPAVPAPAVTTRPAVQPPSTTSGRTGVGGAIREGVLAAARRKPKPTIMQIAQEFKVSTATVSRILRSRINGSGDGEGPVKWESQESVPPGAR